MNKYLIVLLILITLLSGCSAKADAKDPAPRQTNTFDGPRKDEPIADPTPDGEVRKYSDSTIIVSFNSAPTEEQLKEVEKMCDGELKNMMMETIAVIKFEPKTAKAILVLADNLNKLDYVKNAEPDYIIELPGCSKVPC